MRTHRPLALMLPLAVLALLAAFRGSPTTASSSQTASRADQLATPPWKASPALSTVPNSGAYTEAVDPFMHAADICHHPAGCSTWSTSCRPARSGSRTRDRPMHRAGPGGAGGRLQRAGPIPRWVRLERDGWYRPAGPRANTRSRFTVTLRTTLAVSVERRGSAQARLS